MDSRHRELTKSEKSKPKAKVKPQPENIHSIPIRSNEAIFRDVQKMRLQDAAQPSKNLLKPLLATSDLAPLS